MKQFVLTLSLAGIALLQPVAESSADNTRLDGEALFMKNCIACHADGGNIVNPRKTLFLKDLESNRVASPDAIVKLLRKPGPGMLTYDAKTLSNEEARSIAEYVLKTFK